MMMFGVKQKPSTDIQIKNLRDLNISKNKEAMRTIAIVLSEYQPTRNDNFNRALVFLVELHENLRHPNYFHTTTPEEGMTVGLNFENELLEKSRKNYYFSAYITIQMREKYRFTLEKVPKFGHSKLV